MIRNLKMLLLIVPLLSMIVLPVQRETEAATQNASYVVGSVTSQGNQFTIQEAILIDGHLSYSLKVKNNGNSDLDFVNYWVKVVNRSGVSFTSKVVGDDKPIVPGKAEKIFQFTSNVGTNVKLKDLSFKIIKWDFSQASYQLDLGTISVPAAYSPATARDQQRTITFSGLNFNTKAVRTTVIEGQENYSLTVEFEIENIGNKEIKMPGVKFSAVTGEGIMYGLDAGDLSAVVLKPKMKEKLTLNGILPLSTDTNKLNLLFSTLGDGEASMPVALYILPAATVGQSYGINSVFRYTVNKGAYDIQLKSVQRLPWEDQDIITAEFVITNPTNANIPALQLAAEIVVDGVPLKSDEIKVLKLDNVIGISSNSTVKYIVFAKVPYTYDYESVKVQLQQVVGEKKEQIYTAQFKATEYMMPVVAQNNSYHIDAIGTRTSLAVKNVRSYPATELSNELYYVELEASNLEKRLIDFSQIAAYFKTMDGIFFPAVLSEVKTKLQPQAKVLLGVWAEIPEGYDVTDMELLLGQAVTDTGLAAPGQEATAYIRSAALKIPKELQPTENNLSKLSVYPFELSLSKVKTFVVNDTSFKMEFTYDLNQLNKVNQIVEKHQIVIEIDDGITKVEKKYNIGKQPTDTSGDTYLNFGNGEKKAIVFTDPNFFYMRQFADYTLNIYDEFKGHKKLIGSKKLKWFVESD
ncbi:MAG TPA: hypothetical protein VEZ72_07990 [Paenibacillus sp.]|nr:hypothetical protein [Paenibacillus sp.]